MAGNSNSGRKQEKPFRDALRLELAAAEKKKRGLRVIARKLIEAAEEGKMDAIKELADRMDGKSVQAVAGDPENPLQLITRVELVPVSPKK